MEITLVTPVRNDAWILAEFLSSSSEWADRIIILDQQSTDQSRSIARSFSHVNVITNDSSELNEAERKEQLLVEARKTSVDRRIVFALDSDEILTCDPWSSPEWKSLSTAPEGTVFRLEWINVKADGAHFWSAGWKAFAFVDNGAALTEHGFHGERVPTANATSIVDFSTLKVLHLQYINELRMKSKQRWYQCLETLDDPTASGVRLYRTYNHMKLRRQDEVMNRGWIDAGLFKKLADAVEKDRAAGYYWYDVEIMRILCENGVEIFRKIEIWDQDWGAVASRAGFDACKPLGDPRSALQRLVHWILRVTQPYANQIWVRVLTRGLSVLGF